jgi:hypothetical protein
MRPLLPHLLWIGALMGLLALAAPHFATRPPADTPAVPPSAAILETCRAMYPTQPDLEQACVRRWTKGETMPGPTTMPQDDVVVQWCSGLVGIPPVRPRGYQLPPETLQRWLEGIAQRVH